MKGEKKRMVLETAMTVGQIREELARYDDDAIPFFVCNYGDYHRTQQALPVENISDALMLDIRETAYSQSGLALTEDDPDRDDRLDEDDDDRTVVILRS